MFTFDSKHTRIGYKIRAQEQEETFGVVNRRQFGGNYIPKISFHSQAPHVQGQIEIWKQVFKTFHIFCHFVTQQVARKFCGKKVSPVNHCDYAAPIRSPRSWANGFFKNRGSSCKRSLNLSTQLSRGLFAENRLGALLSNRNACYAGYFGEIGEFGVAIRF